MKNQKIEEKLIMNREKMTDNKGKKISIFLYLLLIGFVFLIIFVNCRSLENNNNKVYPFRSTSSIRIDDIKDLVDDNPIAALNFVYIYKEIYSNLNNDENNDWAQMLMLEEKAVKNLCEMQEKAVKEEKWEEAIALGRSLASIQITTSHTGKEADFLLADAKKKLSEDNTLGAFLAAVSSHEMKPLDFDSAYLFLEKAVEGKQRRAASYFLSAATRISTRNIPVNLRDYALGRDNFSEMIKGVATVIVDRGFKVERGMGFQNRVLGSAFFIDSSGLMITNYHVIESEVDPKYKGYSRLYIRTGDAASPLIPARVIGWDKVMDLALIKTEISPDMFFLLLTELYRMSVILFLR